MDNPFGLEVCLHGNPGYCLACEYGESNHDSMIGELLECYNCAPPDDFGSVTRKVVAYGSVIEQHRDPTQTYKLECGHTVI